MKNNWRIFISGALLLSLVSIAAPVYATTNLLTNPGAETGDFTGWALTGTSSCPASGGNCWAISGDVHSGSHSFISSYATSTMGQEVNLVTSGYTTAYLDTAPQIDISTYVMGAGYGSGTNDRYGVKIELRNASHGVITSYDTGTVTATSSWAQFTRSFTNYGSGVRYIYLEQDGKGDANFWAGYYGAIFDDAVVTVATDTTAPAITALLPADNTTGVSTTANLIMTFSEAVNTGSGNITIKKAVDNSTVETIAVTDSAKVTGSGTTTITINPATTLSALVPYYIQVDATAFVDISNNSYIGITDTTSWNFTTAGTAGVTVSAISGNTTEANGTATFTVVLDTEPSASVTIPVTSSNIAEGTVSPAALMFTNLNWATPQTVTVTGVNDDSVDGNVSYAIVLAATVSSDTNYNGFNPTDVSVTNTDNDIAASENNMPVFSGSLPAISFMNGTTTSTVFDLDDYFTDLEDDEILTYSVVGAINIEVQINAGAVTVSAPAAFSGTEILVFSATDTSGATASSNEVPVIVEPSTVVVALSDVSHVTGTAKGKGNVQVIAKDGTILASWMAFPQGGVIPRIATVDDSPYLFTVKRHSGTTIHVYSLAGDLVKKRRLSTELHWRQLAVGNLDNNTSNQEIVVGSRRNTTVFFKVFSYHPTAGTFGLRRQGYYQPIYNDNYELSISKHTVHLVNSRGKTQLDWHVFK